MQNTGKKICDPSAYVTKRGKAFVEVAAMKEEIIEWTNNGYSIIAIYRMLIDQKIISQCVYRTFLNAVNKMIPEVNKVFGQEKQKAKKKINPSEHPVNKSEKTKEVLKHSSFDEELKVPRGTKII